MNLRKRKYNTTESG